MKYYRNPNPPRTGNPAGNGPSRFTDEDDAWGVTPDNLNADYLGFYVRMAREKYLRLAAPLTEPEKNAAVAAHMATGGKLATPILYVAIPPEWEDADFSQPASVKGHEGRNRMTALPPHTIENVLIIPYGGGWRARHITPSMVDEMNRRLIAQRSDRVERDNYAAEQHRTGNPTSYPLGHGIRPAAEYRREDEIPVQTRREIRNGTFDPRLRLTPRLNSILTTPKSVQQNRLVTGVLNRYLDARQQENDAREHTEAHERFVQSWYDNEEYKRPTGIYTQYTRWGNFAREISANEVRKEAEAGPRQKQRETKAKLEAAADSAIRFFRLFAETAPPDATDDLPREVARAIDKAGQATMVEKPQPENSRAFKKAQEYERAAALAAIEALIMQG